MKTVPAALSRGGREKGDGQETPRRGAARPPGGPEPPGHGAAPRPAAGSRRVAGPPGGPVAGPPCGRRREDAVLRGGRAAGLPGGPVAGSRGGRTISRFRDFTIFSENAKTEPTKATRDARHKRLVVTVVKSGSYIEP